MVKTVERRAPSPVQAMYPLRFLKFGICTGTRRGCRRTIFTVARVHNRAGGLHARVRLRLQRLSQNLRINSHPQRTRSGREMPQMRQQERGAGSNRVLRRDWEEELG